MQVQRRTACKRVKGRGTAPGLGGADAATAARTCAVKPRLMLLCSSDHALYGCCRMFVLDDSSRMESDDGGIMSVDSSIK